MNFRVLMVAMVADSSCYQQGHRGLCSKRCTGNRCKRGRRGRSPPLEGLPRWQHSSPRRKQHGLSDCLRRSFAVKEASQDSCLLYQTQCATNPLGARQKLSERFTVFKSCQKCLQLVSKPRKLTQHADSDRASACRLYCGGPHALLFDMTYVEALALNS
jgi:hypothetical protein